jgi:hypothetical protein
MELWNDGWGTGWVNWRNSSLRSRVTIALGVILTKEGSAFSRVVHFVYI